MRKQLAAVGLFTLHAVICNLSPAFAQGGATPPYTNAYFQSLNDNTTYPCGIGPPGVTPTAQLNSALQQTQYFGGGAVDLTCYKKAMTITADVFSPISAEILIWGGEHAITVNANATIPSNFEICFGPGGSIAAGVGFTLTNNASSCLGGGSGAGTVTDVACDPLLPLFTCNVTTPTTTPVLVFTLDTASAGSIFGNFTGAVAAPSFVTPPTCGDSSHALNFNTSVPFGFDCQAITGSGSGVTSVGEAFEGTVYNVSVTNSPITSAGTLLPSLVDVQPGLALMGPQNGNGSIGRVVQQAQGFSTVITGVTATFQNPLTAGNQIVAGLACPERSGFGYDIIAFSDTQGNSFTVLPGANNALEALATGVSAGADTVTVALSGTSNCANNTLVILETQNVASIDTGTYANLTGSAGPFGTSITTANANEFLVAIAASPSASVPPLVESLAPGSVAQIEGANGSIAAVGATGSQPTAGSYAWSVLGTSCGLCNNVAFVGAFVTSGTYPPNALPTYRTIVESDIAWIEPLLPNPLACPSGEFFDAYAYPGAFTCATPSGGGSPSVVTWTGTVGSGCASVAQGDVVVYSPAWGGVCDFPGEGGNEEPMGLAETSQTTGNPVTIDVIGPSNCLLSTQGAGTIGRGRYMILDTATTNHQCTDAGTYSLSAIPAGTKVVGKATAAGTSGNLIPTMLFHPAFYGVEGGSGSPGGASGTVQYNNGGAFGGVAGSSVDTSGDVAIAPTASTATAWTSTAAANQEAGDFFSSGTEPQGTIFALSNLGTVTTGLNGTAGAFITEATDNSAAGATLTSLALLPVLQGSNVTSDSLFGLVIGMGSNWSGGQPGLVEGINIYATGGSIPGNTAVTAAGIEIQDQNMGAAPATSINAAILLDSQTAGANVFSLHTGAGPGSIGDIFSPGTLTLATGTSETATYGEGYFFNCSDCDTPPYVGAVATNTGNNAGTLALYIEGEVISIGPPANPPIANIQVTTGTTGVWIISGNTCTGYTAASMPGVKATSSFTDPTPTADVSGVTGFGSTGGLVFVAYPSTDTYNWEVCNQTASPITPSSSVTWNVGAN